VQPAAPCLPTSLDKGLQKTEAILVIEVNVRSAVAPVHNVV